ncbi:hypothetical protein CHUAL_001251 [Chamberlinius hualienensis]
MSTSKVNSVGNLEENGLFRICKELFKALSLYGIEISPKDSKSSKCRYKILRLLLMVISIQQVSAIVYMAVMSVYATVFNREANHRPDYHRLLLTGHHLNFIFILIYHFRLDQINLFVRQLSKKCHSQCVDWNSIRRFQTYCLIGHLVLTLIHQIIFINSMISNYEYYYEILYKKMIYSITIADEAESTKLWRPIAVGILYVIDLYSKIAFDLLNCSLVTVIYVLFKCYSALNESIEDNMGNEIRCYQINKFIKQHQSIAKLVNRFNILFSPIVLLAIACFSINVWSGVDRIIYMEKLPSHVGHLSPYIPLTVLYFKLLFNFLNISVTSGHLYVEEITSQGVGC